MIAKRLFDVLASGCGLLLLMPLLLLIAVAIKFDTAGPVFFRQVRVGRHGVRFRIHKFRTMRHTDTGIDPELDPDSDTDLSVRRTSAQITIGADARITRVGAVLRRTKLDELAQLIDVLRGDMSLVGPRPEVPQYLPRYPAHLREKLLSVRPGITDVASLAYRDESALLARACDADREYVEVLLPAKLALSARGIDEASFAGDLRLIAMTICALWRGRTRG